MNFKAECKLPRKKIKNAVLFLRLGLPSTLIRHENGTFRKRSSNRLDLKTSAFRFPVATENISKTKLFENILILIIISFPVRVFSKHKSKIIGGLLRFNFFSLA